MPFFKRTTQHQNHDPAHEVAEWVRTQARIEDQAGLTRVSDAERHQTRQVVWAQLRANPQTAQPQPNRRGVRRRLSGWVAAQHQGVVVGAAAMAVLLFGLGQVVTPTGGGEVAKTEAVQVVADRGGTAATVEVDVFAYDTSPPPGDTAENTYADQDAAAAQPADDTDHGSTTAEIRFECPATCPGWVKAITAHTQRAWFEEWTGKPFGVWVEGDWHPIEAGE